MFVVVCFWHRNCEVNSFKTYDKAFKFMVDDFVEVLESFGRTMDNMYHIVDEDGYEDTFSFINDSRAEICNEDIEDNYTWCIEEIGMESM